MNNNPSLKDQLKLRRGSKIVALLIAIEHPDGEQMAVSLDDLLDSQIDIETNIDFNTGLVTQTGYISARFRAVVIAPMSDSSRPQAAQSQILLDP